MLGLQQGTVALYAHDEAWMVRAKETCRILKGLLGDAAVDIQHVGSTAVPGLMAKPIVDIVVGVRKLGDLDPYVEKLMQAGIYERGQDQTGQRLFVMGDFEANMRTHHIHVVRWNDSAWKNYIRFRDYLRIFEEKRSEYEVEKRRLAAWYPVDRQAYTEGKAELIGRLIEEANRWAEEGKCDG